MGRLQGLHKLAVAVVHQDGRVGVGRLDDLAHLPNFRHGQGVPGGVALGALNQHSLHLGIRGRPGHALQVRLIVKEIYLPIFHAVVLQGAGPLVHHTDGAQQGVIGGAHGGHQHIPRLQRAKEGGGDGVGAVDKLQADQRRLRSEEVGVNFIQLVPTQIVIAIAGGSGKVGLRHPVLLERRQNPGGILLGDGVDAVKLLSQLSLRLVSQVQDTLA